VSLLIQVHAVSRLIRYELTVATAEASLLWTDDAAGRLTAAHTSGGGQGGCDLVRVEGSALPGVLMSVRPSDASLRFWADLMACQGDEDNLPSLPGKEGPGGAQTLSPPSLSEGEGQGSAQIKARAKTRRRLRAAGGRGGGGKAKAKPKPKAKRKTRDQVRHTPSHEPSTQSTENSVSPYTGGVHRDAGPGLRRHDGVRPARRPVRNPR
jgi:hypothetical protein